MRHLLNNDSHAFVRAVHLRTPGVPVELHEPYTPDPPARPGLVGRRSRRAGVRVKGRARCRAVLRP